jgi:hypothetical protein
LQLLSDEPLFLAERVKPSLLLPVTSQVKVTSPTDFELEASAGVASNNNTTVVYPKFILSPPLIHTVES